MSLINEYSSCLLEIGYKEAQRFHMEKENIPKTHFKYYQKVQNRFQISLGLVLSF